jgi:hypothetical protein
LDKNPTPDHTRDVENLSPDAPPNNRARCNSFSTIPKKAVKLALGLTAVAGLVALGAVLGLKSSLDKPKLIQEEDTFDLKSSLDKPELIQEEDTFDSLEVKVKMISLSSSITNGNFTCFSDLKMEIWEALMNFWTLNNCIDNETCSDDLEKGNAEAMKFYALNCVDYGGDK